MKTLISKTTQIQAETVAAVMADYISQNPAALLCLAAGDTPTQTYAEMVRMQQEGRADFRHCRLIGLDEWVGIRPNQPGSCKKYIFEHVIDPLGLRPENIFFFDACAEDPEEECHKANQYLKAEGPIDISLMGVGMNGHIGLNEPGCSFDADAHLTDLKPLTVQVAEKYFGGKAPITRGVTLGMGQILASRLLIVMANGS